MHASRLLLVAVCALLLTACRDDRPSGSPSPTQTPELARVLDRGDPSTSAVALMFDVGDDAGRTEDILRTLRGQQVRATFVVTGVWAEQHRELLFSISAEGHQIINGTYDGRSWTGASTGELPLSAAERALELSRAEVTVYRYTSQSTRPYFRPPYDDLDDSVLLDAAANGYAAVIKPAITVAANRELPASIVEGELGGMTIAVDGGLDPGVVASIISSIRQRTYDFITVGELAQ